MKNLIEEIKLLSKKLYNAEISAKDEEFFETLGMQTMKQIRNVLREAIAQEHLVVTK
jgi:hypothetical protein